MERIVTRSGTHFEGKETNIRRDISQTNNNPSPSDPLPNAQLQNRKPEAGPGTYTIKYLKQSLQKVYKALNQKQKDLMASITSFNQEECKTRNDIQKECRICQQAYRRLKKKHSFQCLPEDLKEDLKNEIENQLNLLTWIRMEAKAAQIEEQQSEPEISKSPTQSGMKKDQKEFQTQETSVKKNNKQPEANEVDSTNGKSENCNEDIIEIKGQKYQLIDCGANGDCFYSAAAHLLYSDQTKQAQIRAEMAKKVIQYNEPSKAPEALTMLLITEYPNYDLSDEEIYRGRINRLAKNIQRTGKQATQITPLFLALTYGRRVVTYDGANERIDQITQPNGTLLDVNDYVPQKEDIVLHIYSEPDPNNHEEMQGHWMALKEISN